MLRANLVTLSFIESEIWAIEVYIAGIGILDVFGSCDLDLDPVTLTLTRWLSYTNLTRIAWKYTGCENKNFLRQGFRKLSSVRYTDRQNRPNYKPCRFAGSYSNNHDRINHSHINYNNNIHQSKTPISCKYLVSALEVLVLRSWAAMYIYIYIYTGIDTGAAKIPNLDRRLKAVFMNYMLLVCDWT